MTFEDLALKTVAMAYREDRWSAGIVTAWLDEKQCFYASLQRYPEGIDGPKVIAAHGYSIIGSKHAIQMLMFSWTNNPTPGARVALVRRFSIITGKQLREAQRKAMK